MKSIAFKQFAALLFMLMATANALANDEDYAVFTSNDKTLTFYSDNLKSTRPGTAYDLNIDDWPLWYEHHNQIKKVVFNPSFSRASRPYRLASKPWKAWKNPGASLPTAPASRAPTAASTSSGRKMGK